MNDAYATVQRWERAFNDGDHGAVAALYAPGAILWGTLASTLIITPDAIGTYFAEAARAGLKVTLGEHASIAISGTSVVDAGHYELVRLRDGQKAVFPARYSFVLVRSNDAWMIAHHHSSMLPKPLG